MPPFRPSRASFAAFIAIATACASERDAPRVRVSTNLITPKALLSGAKALAINVYDESAAITCDPKTGLTDANADTAILTSATLGTTCDDGAAFCGDLSVPIDSTTRTFEAIATKSDGSKLAVGCATAVIDKAEVALDLKMLRYIAPAKCGNGKLEPTEQCESPGTKRCSASCQSLEFEISAPTQGGATAAEGDKYEPFFLWPAATAEAGQLFALYTDRTPGQLDIGLRILSDDLSPVATPAELTSNSIFLPNGSPFPPSAAAKNQSTPAAARIGTTTYVVFQDDATSGVNGVDIHLRSIDSTFTSAQGATPIGINGASGGGEVNVQSHPRVASGANGKLFIVWQNEGASGKIYGRTFIPTGSVLGNQQELSSGTSNISPDVCATPNGFIATWQSGADIKVRVVGSDGTPAGADQTVNDLPSSTDAHPQIAALEDGRFAVVWVSGTQGKGDIYVQRFSENGKKISGDQSAPVNDLVSNGDQVAPVIAAMSALDGSYALAWLDSSSGNIRARLLGGTGSYVFNNVDGTSSEFAVTKGSGTPRKTPVVAVGGADPTLLIGWEDASESGFGIFGRTFPLPTE